MSYLGLTRPISRWFLSRFKTPEVLEIGVDKGQTALPLINNLSLGFKTFSYVGIDINIQQEVIEQISQFEHISFIPLGDSIQKRDVHLFEDNSLSWLEKNKDTGLEFDLILVDGDHNYFTVKKELELLQYYIRNTSIIVCDDFQGRYAESDMFYYNYTEYADNQLTTKPVESEKQGVKHAVIDFIKESSINFGCIKFGELEPCIIYNQDYLKVYTKELPKTGNLRDMKINFDFLQE